MVNLRYHPDQPGEDYYPDPFRVIDGYLVGDPIRFSQPEFVPGEFGYADRESALRALLGNYTTEQVAVDGKQVTAYKGDRHNPTAWNFQQDGGTGFVRFMELVNTIVPAVLAGGAIGGAIGGGSAGGAAGGAAGGTAGEAAAAGALTSGEIAGASGAGAFAAGGAAAGGAGTAATGATAGTSSAGLLDYLKIGSSALGAINSLGGLLKSAQASSTQPGVVASSPVADATAARDQATHTAAAQALARRRAARSNSLLAAAGGIGDTTGGGVIGAQATGKTALGA